MRAAEDGVAFLFFFQAEDGIRDLTVTGVQTCALPIWIAVYKAFESYVAEVAEVSLASDGAVKVHRVVCAVDCGPVVNPSIVEAQMESAIVFGLTAALYGEIAIEGGRVKQSNFHDYPMVRLAEM